MTDHLRRLSIPILAVLCGIAGSWFWQPAAANSGSLVGLVVEGNASKAPMTAAEVQAMHPACIAIGMGRIDGLFWSEGLKKKGLEGVLDRPENAMAKGAAWFHHYCWGMLSKMRSVTAPDKSRRETEVRIWRANMQFIIDWTSKQGRQWAYLPNIHAELAENYLVDKNYAGAIQSAGKALELNPRYVDAYWILADSYLATGNRAKALEFVTEGLRHVPGARALVRRYRELGGSDPMPEPYPRDGRDQPVEPMGEPEAVTPAIDEAPGQVESQETIEPNPVQQTTDAPAMPEKPPGNPYCRFCP